MNFVRISDSDFDLDTISWVTPRLAVTDVHYVPTDSFRRSYRHRLLASYNIYRLNRDSGHQARILLGYPLSAHGQVLETMGSRNEILENPGVMEAIDILYYDPRSQTKAKRGCLSKNGGGRLRQRFPTVIKRLNRTYDTCGMSGPEIINLLPKDFNKYQT